MTFTLNEREDEGAVRWAGEWPFPARAHFIKSRAYDTLLRELTRYVKGEVPGRSFLIAGHRGAGKTSLVRQVVEDLNRTIITKAVEATTSRDRDQSRMLDQQRPLLVKLHGPSLLAPVKQAEAAARKTVAPKRTASKARSKVTAEVPSAEPAPGESSAEYAETDKPAVAAPDVTVIALEQITVALYRALAAEFGRSFTNHARDEIYQTGLESRPHAKVADYLELAGQFTLELDNVPRPGTLRAFYQRLGRVDAGVLWPYQVGLALLQDGLNDRGIREIVALSTAAQAFEVCSGSVKSTQTDKDSRSRESSFETKGAAEFKDVVNKVAGLAVGAGVGAMSLDFGTPAAIVLGVAAWLLSTLTLNWTSKRTAKTERSLDYTFVRNRDKQSLERDLPLVIERVRGAGLAPVFMLDELDKLEDAATSIGTLIKNLKHLTTDFGCFCFLTDRQYYDELMDKVEREAFPVEHTYFSHLLFILPHPDRFLDYLRAITTSASSVPAGSMSTPDPVDVARSIFGLFVLHRSKLNMAEVLRELAEQCDADGRLRQSPADLKSLEYTFAASIQLAISLILKQDGIRQRIEAEPRFLQWAIDVLYLLSRAWEQKKAKVKLDRRAIVECLLKRSGATPAKEGEGPEERLLRTGMGPLDLDLIVRSVQAFAELLCSSDRLRNELSQDNRPAMAEIIPQQDFIKRVGRTLEFTFVYDMYGEEVLVRERLKKALADAGLPNDFKKQINEPLEFLKEFIAALGEVGLEIQHLVVLQILSATIDVTELDRARRRLADATAFDKPYPGLAKDLPLIGAVVGFARQNGEKLAALFRLAFQVAADARASKGDELTLYVALDAVARYVDLRTFFQQSETTSALLATIINRPPDPAGPKLADSVQSVSDSIQSARDWRASLAGLRARLAAEAPSIKTYRSGTSLWDAWQEQVIKHLAGVSSLVEPARYADVVCRAAGVAPGRLFERDLSQTTLLQWSRICVSGFPGAGPAPAPHWVFVAGLCALGFGQSVLRVAIAQLLDESGRAVWEPVVSRAPERKEGYLLVIQYEEASIASEPPNLDRSSTAVPLLALPEGGLKAYNEVFGWLIQHKALAGTIFEEASPDE
ncbi:hypothetical protein [Bradyrhizobium liaoningense]